MNRTSKDIAHIAVASAPRVLIVEDEAALALLIGYNLEAEGYVVESVARGDEAELRLAESAPDLLILDWMLPACRGSNFASAASDPTLPIIMVTARREEAERVRGSRSARMTTSSSHSVPELMARVRALRGAADRADRRTSPCRRPRSGSRHPARAARRSRHSPRANRLPVAGIFARAARPGFRARPVA